mgnify:CR=1 FL=1
MRPLDCVRRRILRLFFIALACSALIPASGASGAERLVRIDIPPSVQVDGTAFALGDIAWISGPDGVRDVLSPLILSVEEGDVVTREQVIRAVEASGLEGVRLEVRMPDRVRVEAAGTDGTPGGGGGRFSPDESLISVIKSLAAWDGDVEVSHAGPVPEGRLVSPGSLVPGTAAATLRFRDGAGRERSLAVRMVWTRDVLVMARSVPRGQPLTAEDFVTRPMRIAKPGVYAVQLSQAVGRTSRRPLLQGKPVPLEFLSEPPAVERGKTVRIVVRRGGLVATVKGVLLDDGAAGAVVRVRRADDKKVVLRARVLDSETVEVDVP